MVNKLFFLKSWNVLSLIFLAVIRLKVNKNILTLVMDSDFKGAEKHKDCQLLDDALEKARKIAYFIRPSKPVQIDVVDRVGIIFFHFASLSNILGTTSKITDNETSVNSSQYESSCERTKIWRR